MSGQLALWRLDLRSLGPFSIGLRGTPDLNQENSTIANFLVGLVGRLVMFKVSEKVPSSDEE